MGGLPRSPLGRAPRPSRAPRDWGGATGGAPGHAFQAGEAGRGHSLFLLPQSTGLSPERGRGSQWGRPLALHPKFPQPRKSGLASLGDTEGLGAWGHPSCAQTWHDLTGAGGGGGAKDRSLTPAP